MSDEMLEDGSDADEKLRIHVPTPDTELVLGRGDNNFVGIMGRVDNGGVFFGAGGFPLGIPSADSSYAGFKKAHTTIGLGISGVAGLAQFVKSFYLKKDLCIFDTVLNGIAFGAGAIPGTLGASMYAGTASAEGNVSLYGDSGVALASPMTASVTAGLAASLNGSLASVNGVVSASMNALVTSVNGVKGATLSALAANVIGLSEVTVASRSGTTSIQGASIELGKPSGAIPGQAYKGVLTGGQDATDRIDVRADSMVNIEPGKAVDKFQGAPTKLQVTPDAVRAETKKSALMVDDEVVIHSGSSVVSMGAKSLKLFHAAAPIKEMVDGVVKPAELAWTAAYEAADEIEESLQTKTLLTLGAAMGAGAVGIPAALASDALPLDGDAQAAATGGLAAGGVALGAVLGGLATVGVTTLVERQLAAKAKKAAKKVADRVYASALKGAVTTERAAVAVQGKIPTNPQIEITADAIILSVGTSKVSIKATGVEIDTAIGAMVKVNGQTFAKGVMTNLDVKS